MLTATWRPVRLLATCLSAMALSSGAQAGYVYTYQGNTYTGVSGSNPHVTTSDSVTGFVEFATLPTAGQVGKNDWIAYSLSDGARTFSSANGDGIDGDDFSFDSNLNILTWSLSMIPRGGLYNFDAILTTSHYDITRIDAGHLSMGMALSGSIWTRQFDVAAVPEPETLPLVLLSLTTVMLWIRPRKQAGAVAPTLAANAELPDVGTARCQHVIGASK